MLTFAAPGAIENTIVEPNDTQNCFEIMKYYQNGGLSSKLKKLKFARIQSGRNFRPKFEVGLKYALKRATDGVALFSPPT